MAEKPTKKRLLVAGNSKSSYQSLTGKVILPAEMDKGGGYQGYIFRFLNETNYGFIGFSRVEPGIAGKGFIKGAEIVVGKVVGGVRSILERYEGYLVEARTGGKLSVTVTATGLITYGYNDKTINSFTDESFILGNTLGEGKVGVHDEYSETPGIAAVRRYSEPLAIGAVANEEEIQNAVCYAGRSMEVRSDGVFRQHKTDDVWARLVPDGFLPYSPPSGLEGRALKGLLLPSNGNFGVFADGGNHKLSAQVFYFPAYHFTSEAI